MATLYFSIHTPCTDTLTHVRITPEGKCHFTWRGVWLTTRATEADSRKHTWIFKLISDDIGRCRSERQSGRVIARLSRAPRDTAWFWLRRCVSQMCPSVFISRHFQDNLTNIPMFTRHSGSYLRRDYHRMLQNSQSCLETESQSCSPSPSHGGLVWS